MEEFPIFPYIFFFLKASRETDPNPYSLVVSMVPRNTETRRNLAAEHLSQSLSSHRFMSLAFQISLLTGIIGSTYPIPFKEQLGSKAPLPHIIHTVTQELKISGSDISKIFSSIFSFPSLQSLISSNLHLWGS